MANREGMLSYMEPGIMEFTCIIPLESHGKYSTPEKVGEWSHIVPIKASPKLIKPMEAGS